MGRKGTFREKKRKSFQILLDFYFGGKELGGMEY